MGLHQHILTDMACFLIERHNSGGQFILREITQKATALQLLEFGKGSLYGPSLAGYLLTHGIRADLAVDHDGHMLFIGIGEGESQFLVRDMLQIKEEHLAFLGIEHGKQITYLA
ncbi:hypothetical protein SDC9_98656 [bioreactor metagenome]|uniref:Uncharacterized protein n=1 Tax=bioreactor metagenome TaxID=1076179 RepID=A0A645AQM9_9ZZZZ